MITRKTELAPDKRENMRGGEGYATLNLVPAAKKPENWTLTGIIEVAAHSTIGGHEHVGECEMFYFLDAARVMDDGEETTVQPGDIMFTPSGHSHAVFNDTDAPIRLLAIIVRD